MSRDRAMELWSRHCAGESLSPAESRELLEILRADAELRDHLMRNDEVDGLLRALHWTDPDAALFEQSFEERVGAEHDGAQFIRSMESRLAAEGAKKPRSTRRFMAAPPSGNPWAWGLAAAALLCGLIYLVSAPLPRPVQSTSRRDPAPARPAVGPRERLELENKLAEAEENRRRATEAKQREADESKAAELRAREVELERTVAEFRARLAAAPGREAQASAPPTPEPPAPAPPKPVQQTEARVVAAKFISLEGDVFAVDGERTPARAGTDLFSGQGLDVAGTATLEFGDKTRIELGPATIVKEVRVDAKRVVLEKGTLRAEVEMQPQGRPMVFATPHGEATVLGTILRIIVDPDPKKGTRLEVEEGRVQFRKLGGKSVDILTGYYAVAASGLELAARPMPADEILLRARQGTRVGAEWKLVEDAKASTGFALEVHLEIPRSRMQLPSPPLRHIPAFVSFRFRADADKDYAVWIRGLALPTKGQPFLSDAVIIEVPGAIVTQTAGGSSGGPQTAEFNGYSRRSSFWWMGGWGDVVRGAPGDAVPVSVRFSRSGNQTLRLYAWEAPLRIDTLWLSTTQKTRPDDTQFGPKTQGR